ncbi:methyl-accepting chemotaxis protein [Peteryoungia algae]|uniref:PAS domain-containing methyl-accepting chemotaxis protein n=1 Tax=Peteryoungia algae TaxID=2919917 RepID=A0ABT0D4M9_9HYPH|nr:PAS domain-containing methyl-accepting chemotaxis protein [Rhizobium sp. SSM4.3]MCJ8240366.1 PAS domain-containing methyl-accepting chemotaxis protein [Rhizobium sp. SSM4.3]
MLSNYLNANKLADDMRALSKAQAMISFAPDGTILEANENFLKTLGYRLEEIVGKHHRIFCDEELRQSPDYQRFWPDLAAGRFQSGQFRRQSKAGDDVWIEATYNPVFHGGRVVRILKIASDITASKIAALHDGNRLRAIDQSQAIIEFEVDGAVVQANDNFLKAMGYDQAEIIGKHHRMFCDPAYVDTPDYARFWERLRAGEFIASNFVRYGKGGREVWIQAAYTPVFNSRGKVYKVIKVATDISPRMRAVKIIGQAIKRLADGDLTVRLTESLDPVLENTRHDVNTAAEALDQTMTGIVRAAQTLSENAAVISEVSNSIASNGERQAATVEETAAALEEINRTVKDTTTRTLDTTRLVGETRANAEASGTIVTQATTAMGEIAGSSREIENIIGVIDEIAFQTNLLALNAGVEAARAGEAGKGFAVVAQEVRELAQRSASAAKDIKGLIAKSADAVRHGVALVDKTGHALVSIVDQVQEIDGNVDAISVAARDQAQGIGEINGSISMLDKVTQQSAATVEEASAAANSLADGARDLYGLVSRFQTSALKPGQMQNAVGRAA